MTAPRLCSIVEVVHVVANVAATASTYEHWLGYQIVEKGSVSKLEAHEWQTPEMVGRESVTLAPASGEKCRLRFVQSASAAGYRALTTFGWTATEFTVADVDELAARLASSPFEIIGSPKSLTRFPMIRAMQAIGPAGECLYFTQIGEGSGLDLAPARSFVGRVFIVVAAGPDVHEMFQPYAAFDNVIDPPVATPVTVISQANGLPPDTLHPHGLVKIGHGTMIELDGYPAAASPRTVAPGELPPGMAMVTLAHTGSDAEPRVVRGSAGELIRLVPTLSPELQPATGAFDDACA
jgi:hypothetical protein